MGDFRQLVFDLPDGRQVLVDIWPDGPPTLAERMDISGIWGPPVVAAKDTARERVT